MKINKKILLIIIGIAFGALSYISVINYLKPHLNIVYVDNTVLFNDFVMTKELKKNGEKEFNYKKALLDSMYLKIQSASITDKTILMKEFISQREELEQFNQSFASAESLKIWSRIHTYTNGFAKENGYDLILNSDNKNSVLFATGTINITNELLTYINKKYEGIQ